MTSHPSFGILNRRENVNYGNEVCDFCHKEGRSFPCYACGDYKWCTPMCRALDFIDHQKNCKKTINIGWKSNEYDHFTTNDMIRNFLCAFSYFIYTETPDNLPTCEVILQNGNFLALTGSINRHEKIPKRKPGTLDYMFKLKTNSEGLIETFFNVLVISDYDICKKLYENIFKSVLDSSEDEKIDINLYNPPLDCGRIIKSIGAYKKGGDKIMFVLS